MSYSCGPNCSAGGAHAAPRQAPNTVESLSRAQREALARALDPEDCDCPAVLACKCRGECVLDDGTTLPDAAPCPCCAGECDCLPAAYQPPCPHVRAVRIDLPLETLVELLHGLRPNDYADPLPPGLPASPLVPGDDAHLAAVDEYADRHMLGWGLWDATDPWRSQPTAAVQRGRRRLVVDEDEPEPLPDPRVGLLAEVRALLAAREARRAERGLQWAS